MQSLTISDTISLGTALAFTITVIDSDSTPFRVYAVHGTWRDSTAVLPYQTNVNISMTRLVSDTGNVSFTFFVFDTTGLVSNQIVKQVYIKHTQPTVTFAADSIQVNLSDSTAIKIQKSANTKRIVWQLDSAKADTNVLDSIRVFISDTTKIHLLTAFGIDTFGYRGAADTLRIRAQSSDIKSALLRFPRTFPQNAGPVSLLP